MSLAELIGLDETMIPNKSQAAVRYLEARWIEKGRPAGSKELQTFLDEALKFCAQGAFYYPAYYLKRLKQLQRGQWSPESEMEVQSQ